MQNNNGQNGWTYYEPNAQAAPNAPAGNQCGNGSGGRRMANPYAPSQPPAPYANDSAGYPQPYPPAAAHPARAYEPRANHARNNMSGAVAAYAEPVPARKSTANTGSQKTIWMALLRVSSAVLAVLLIAIGLWFGVPTMLDFNWIYGIAIILVSVSTALCVFASAQLLIRIWRQK